MSRQINRRRITPHTLINHFPGLRDTTILDRRHLAAVRVRHEAVGQGDHALGLAVVGGAAGAGGTGGGGGVVEGDLAFAGLAFGAGVGAARDVL